MKVEVPIPAMVEQSAENESFLRRHFPKVKVRDGLNVFWQDPLFMRRLLVMFGGSFAWFGLESMGV